MSTPFSRALAFACSSLLIAPAFAEVPDEFLRSPLAERYGTGPLEATMAALVVTARS